jgi:hypothetical protein
LEVEVAMEVAGKKFKARPQYVTQGFNGESAGQRLVSIRELGRGTVKVNGREIDSDVRQMVINGSDQRRTTTVHYCSAVEPFVLKRETNTTDVAGHVTLAQNVVDVVALDMPLKVLDKMKTVSHVKTTSTRPAGATVTLETHCLDVPGTVVAHTSKEVDESGRVLRRSSLELVDYYVDDGRDDGHRRRLFHRRAKGATRSGG